MNTSQYNSELPISANNDEIDISSLVDTLVSAKWLIILTTTVVVAIATVYVFLASPIYRADTLIQVENSGNSTNAALGDMATLFNVESPASAEMEILQSRKIVGQATDELNLYISARPNYLPIIGHWLADYSTTLSEPMWGGYVTGREEISIGLLDVPAQLEEQQLEVTVTSTGYSLFDTDGKLIVNGKAGSTQSFEYNGQAGKIKISDIQGKPGAKFLIKRSSRLKTIQQLKERLNISEKGKQSGIISISLEGTNPVKTANILDAIGRAYVQQNIARKAAEAEKSLTFLDSFLPQLKQQMQTAENRYTNFRDTHGTFNLGAEGALSLQMSADLKTKLLELEQKRRELAPRFQPSHPAIQTLDKQIKAIQIQLSNIEKDARKLPDVEQQLLSLTRDVQVNSEMYVNLLNSAQQLKLVKEGKVGNVRVIDKPAVPEQAVKPRKIFIVGLSVILGFILGVGFAFIRRWLKPGLTDPQQIETMLGLHIFATVPHSPTQEKLQDFTNNKQQGIHVLAQTSPDDPAVESLRGLRSSLQFSMAGAKNKAILLTGPTPGLGKSFSSVNLAAVFGASDQRVLLIDADLRKGYLNQQFGITRDRGLSNYLCGQIDIDSAIKQEVLPNVDFIPTGPLPPNPSELLLSPRLGEAIKILTNRYDVVLLDAAPILPVSDAAIIASQTGTTLLVARASISTLGEIQESARRLNQTGARITGVVFNDLTPSSNKYGSKYGHYRYTHYDYAPSKQ